MGEWLVADVERALQHVQTFDPIGVAARDLQECLWLQIRQLGLEGTPTEKIVTDHLRLLQNHQVPEIARKLGMTIDDLKEHVEIIRNLDPKPGSRYNPSQSQYVIPDVYVVKVEDQYVAALNEEGLPQLRISPVYKRLLDKTAPAVGAVAGSGGGGGGGEQNDETRAYVKDKFRSALWLIKSVDQRQKTIHKVATSIINFQREFLDHGIEYLRPLVLRDVANDIGMHESTVSRVVNNKYMHTPQGVFELKYFFHSGISSSYGESVSSVTIKQRIRKIIENEDPRKPLSDSKIVSILQKEGLMLARRTIAKYREELKIPTSNQRKVLF
jgi:RNA polymerase sigma-54 factor